MCGVCGVGERVGVGMCWGVAAVTTGPLIQFLLTKQSKYEEDFLSVIRI